MTSKKTILLFLNNKTALYIFKDKFLYIEDCSINERPINRTSMQGLVGLVHAAFDQHRPLIISPDDVWLTISKGLAKHIELNAEELRHHFVDFEGKTDIVIQRDAFVKGQSNDWAGVFPEFSDKISEYIGKKRDLIVSDFTTTTPLTKIISEITLMDAMKKYFRYGVDTRCGISRVTLTGDVDDWKNIKTRVNSIKEFNLSWWTDKLEPVIDEFIAASKGNPNVEFWKSLYNENGGSGAPTISGNVLAFYPYLKDDKKSSFNRTSSDSIDDTIASAPFTWNYHGAVYPMSFFGGAIGIEQIESGEIQSAYSWGIRESSVAFLDIPIKHLKKDMIISSSTENGLLKKVDVITYDDITKNISDVVIEWEKSGTIEYHKDYKDEQEAIKNKKKTDSFYSLNELFIKGTIGND